jgi:hypothetical protein
MRANNPLQLALWELPTIWPSSPKPAVAVSVGTGYSVAAPLTDVPLRGILKDGFIPRVFRSLMASPSLHGQNSWSATMNSVEPHFRYCYHRLNLPLDATEPEMDDVSQMPWLRSQVENFLTIDDGPIRAAHALWAASFYFELEQLPAYVDGLFSCQGNILCRRSAGGVFTDAIVSQFPEAAMVVNESETLGHLGVCACCEQCRYFSMPVSFEARSLTESVSMHLRLSRDEQWIISGFPHDLTWFIGQQDLQPYRKHERSIAPAGGCFCCRASKKRRLPTECEIPRKHKKSNHTPSEL